MSEIVRKIKEELLKRCDAYNKKYGYDFWNDHIKYVVKNSIELAEKYDADVEIVELGALLHDIAMPSEIGPREEHNIYGAKIADELLTKLNYPEDRKERVKECILRHRGSKDLLRNTIDTNIFSFPVIITIAFNNFYLIILCFCGLMFLKIYQTNNRKNIF